MAEITLDKSDPEVADMVDGWQDGGKYELKVTQITSDDTTITLSMDSAEPAEEPAAEEPAAEPPPAALPEKVMGGKKMPRAVTMVGMVK